MMLDLECDDLILKVFQQDTKICVLWCCIRCQWARRIASLQGSPSCLSAPGPVGCLLMPSWFLGRLCVAWCYLGVQLVCTTKGDVVYSRRSVLLFACICLYSLNLVDVVPYCLYYLFACSSFLLLELGCCHAVVTKSVVVLWLKLFSLLMTGTCLLVVKSCFILS